MQQELKGDSSQREEPAQGVTVRAFLMGLVCSAVVAGGTQYGEIYLRSSRMSDDFSMGGAIFVFFFVVAVVNIVVTN